MNQSEPAAVNSLPPKRRKAFKSFILIFLILILLGASFAAGLFFAGKNENLKALAEKENVFAGKITGLYSDPPKEFLSRDIDFNLFWDAWDALKSDYVDQEKLNEKQMFYGALRGMVASIGDPYTIFMDPKIAEQFSEDLAGTFEGIGAELGMKKEIITIIAPLPDMPAEKAGLQAGDQILAIDKTSTAGMSIDEAVNRIRGQRGTEVTLTIMREKFEKPEDFTITRDKIIVKSVRTDFKDKIMVIKVTNFNDDTLTLFNQAAAQAVEKNPAGIILDLRNNPGGYLETAIEMASEWVEDGPVVIEKKSDESKSEFLARGRARLKGFKTVVLVNQGSASASEIVSGALQDTGKGILVGMKTFGKGSVQTLESLSDGSSIKITVAKWLTPNGRSINDEGIKPDLEVELTSDDYNNSRDPQMDKALEIINKKLELKDLANEKKATSTTEK